MKLIALDTMKFKILALFFLITGFSSVLSQTKNEREFRIDQKVFPENAKNSLKPFLTKKIRIKYYKEFDGEKISYEAKFKKDKLRYSIEFSEDGKLEDVEFIIKKAAIPDATFEAITNYLSVNHSRYRIKKIQQQYLNKKSSSDKVLKVAFQNLILPEINYELVVSSKDKKGFSEYEITFNSNGAYLFSRKSIKSKYDHVLY